MERHSNRTHESPSLRSFAAARPHRFATPPVLFVAVALAALGGTVTPAAAQEFQERVANATELNRMRNFVATQVEASSVVDHFVSPDGSDVDCVDINRQPALLRPEMRGHRIEFQPSTWPEGPEDSALLAKKQTEPMTQQFGLGCPDGSVPIARVSLDTLRRFRTLEDFFKKVPSHLESTASKRAAEPLQAEAEALASQEPPRFGPSALHQYAHAYQFVSNWGAESALNLWNPYVERSSEFSLSQIWVVRGSGANLETVEAGWQLYRDLYGDSRARLFIYFTPDNYGSGGCYNNTCGKFVQTSSTITLGGAFGAYSTYGGTQQEVTLLLYKDGTSGSWWLRYGTTWVGYWPRTLFDVNGLRDLAAEVDFGGEIIDRHVGGRHTYTDMGSGSFPSAGYSRAAYQRGLRYVDTSRIYRDVSLTASRDDSYCYDISYRTSTTAGWLRYFYFGGVGYNANCQ